MRHSRARKKPPQIEKERFHGTERSGREKSASPGRHPSTDRWPRASASKCGAADTDPRPEKLQRRPSAARTTQSRNGGKYRVQPKNPDLNENEPDRPTTMIK